jgi:hypothetical protein
VFRSDCQFRDGKKQKSQPAIGLTSDWVQSFKVYCVLQRLRYEKEFVVRITSWLAALLLFAGSISSAQAQCCYIPPPRAPDMLNQPGYYLYNCQGYLYGPYYVVRPPHLPFQGMLPAPANFPAPSCDFCKPSMYGGAAVLQQQQMGPQHPGGVPGLWMHPAVRSPRDFFMYETDPARQQEYRYGVGRGLALPNGGDR